MLVSVYSNVKKLLLRLFLITLCTLAVCASALAFDRTRVNESPEHISPLLNGQFVPDVIVQTAFGKDIRLLDIVESRPSVILFYRGGWCPYCNRQMAGLIEVEQQILDLGYQIVVISPDSPKRLKEQQTSSEFDVVRLSDSKLVATRAFGLAYYLPESTVQKYQSELGAELVTVEGTSRRALPVPSAFIVDNTGLIKFQYANPNYKVRIEPQLLYYAARVAK
ncbi:MAG: peroxiredoxin-like family protein [Aliiglaciecola sp.]|uniref:peroxiredoxin-like family protein n=1 Tax=Aliiglaciecola sp. M165 TaxID=2593649 RepID=UPI00117DE72B|nr:peroxiredoxin-like family protein [Aliiglaciecola sp. M165]TRY34024.1 AhpC/TSA family protein [Aliiglaciecola sp. M165]